MVFYNTNITLNLVPCSHISGNGVFLRAQEQEVLVTQHRYKPLYSKPLKVKSMVAVSGEKGMIEPVLRLNSNICRQMAKSM